VKANVIVLGAGIIGSSVAYFLSSQGAKVLVVEQDLNPAIDQTASSSAARATGGFRVQYGTSINVQLSLLARQILLDFENRTGVSPGYEPHGYLFLATSQNELESLEAALLVQQQTGLSVARKVNLTEIAQLNPALNLEGVLGGTFCPWDGFIRPLEMLRGFAQSAMQYGAEFKYGIKAKLETRGKKVVVVTPEATLEADAIINCTGAWAGTLGLSIPVTPEKRQIAETVETDVLPADMPMSIYCDSGFHLRVRHSRVLLLRPSSVVSSHPFDLLPDMNWLAPMQQEAVTRVPVLQGIPIVRTWAGLYENSPDKHALFGQHPEYPNFYLINGSSGHGTMHSPAFGQLMSELISTGQTQSLNMHQLRPERFVENDAIKGNSLL
jgi:sarcosine oxidase, subunit beta